MNIYRTGVNKCNYWLQVEKNIEPFFLFQPPRELRYPGYRGAMKLSYVNDMPVSLFNYKNTNNLMAKQPIVK